jgi:hypothetical protein
LDLASDFDEFIASLIAHEVEFLVVGAYALAFHGTPRFTGLDVFVRPTVQNGERLLAAVSAFGFPTPQLGPNDLAAGTKILQMGVEPVQIHVMSALSGVEWDEAWSGRDAGECGRHRVFFIGREAFLKNKRASGRLKDLADIEALAPGAEDAPDR